MSTRGSKVERHSVSNQPHEIKYEAHKQGTSAAKIKEVKKPQATNVRQLKKNLAERKERNYAMAQRRLSAIL